MSASAAARKLLHGTVHGRTIALDEDVQLEGRRVTVLIDVDELSEPMTPTQHRAAWEEWATHGEQGPISDDDERGFP